MATGAIPTDLIRYEPASGVLVWAASRGPVSAGSPASSVNSLGYGRVKIAGRSFLAHRLAWALHHGAWPRGQIDHINGDKLDNRICNLREATRAENQQNRSSCTEHKGVTLVSSGAMRGKWLARCAKEGRRHHIGYFSSQAAAVDAYKQAARRLHGAFFKE